MAIVGAAIVPHSPLLLPSIARDHAPLFSVTLTAMRHIGEAMYAAQADNLIIITPHSQVTEEFPTVHVADAYQGSFVEFGDVTTVCRVSGAPNIAHVMKEAAEHHHVPLALRTYDQLDYGCSVPILSLWSTVQLSIPILPLIVIPTAPTVTLKLGQVLNDFCSSSRKRFFILASADLSRRQRLTGGLHHRPTAEEKRLSQSILAVDPSLCAEYQPQVNTCGFGPISTLLAALQELRPSSTITSFAAPLGVGLLTAQFVVS